MIVEHETRSASTLRLNKYLAQCGICSRREADRLIAEGKITVDGMIAQTGQKVDPSWDIRMEGRSVQPEKEQILLVVNKPRGVVCTTEKKWGDLTIDEFLSYPKRVFSVGRLDKDSEGLLLMTNDGNLQDGIMRGAHFHEKEYVVTVDKVITSEFVQRMSQGIYLEELDVTTRPCPVQRIGEKKFSIVLTQGLNRQIRRMCSACGYSVTALKRTRVMNIELGNLPVGQWREASKEEKDEIYRAVNTPQKGHVKCRK